MKTILLLAILLLVALTCCGADPWKSLWLNVQHLYEIPLTLDDINTGTNKYGTYLKMGHDDELNVDLYSFKDDPRVSLLIDTHGNIGGIRVGYPQDIAPQQGLKKGLHLPAGVYEKPLFQEATYWNMKVWYTDILFLNPEKLMAGGREGKPELVAEEIYLKPNGIWVKVPEHECDLRKEGHWIQQRCMPIMGMHYLYNTTQDQACKDIQDLALMYDYGYLSAVNIITFGTPSSKDGGRMWFDDALNGTLAKKVYPNTPPCLAPWTDDYGVASVHIFLNTKHPSTVVCNAKSQDPDQCKD